VFFPACCPRRLFFFSYFVVCKYNSFLPTSSNLLPTGLVESQPPTGKFKALFGTIVAVLEMKGRKVFVVQSTKKGKYIAAEPALVNFHGSSPSGRYGARKRASVSYVDRVFPGFLEEHKKGKGDDLADAVLQAHAFCLEEAAALASAEPLYV
jgi:hypothetical protein